MAAEYILPAKLGGYLRRLTIEYGREQKSELKAIVSSAHFSVNAGTRYEIWDDGSYGHTVLLYLPELFFERISLAQQQKLSEKILEDLNVCSRGIPGEFWDIVTIEVAEEGDPDFQRARLPLQRLPPDPDKLAIWRQGHIRLFISHRDAYKKKANELSDSLAEFGISCFVAHDNIAATKEWRREILAGLETMEAMLVFLTDDFADSSFTNQEVGFALGKGIPIISLKLESKDPPGFISHEQALRGSIEDPANYALAVAKLVSEKMGRADRLQSAAVAALVSSPSWADTTVRFDRLNSLAKVLTEREVQVIVEGFKRNDQLHHATYLRNRRLIQFLRKTTGLDFVIEGVELKPVENPVGDIPF